jgi:hypothetical protein
MQGVEKVWTVAQQRCQRNTHITARRPGVPLAACLRWYYAVWCADADGPVRVEYLLKYAAREG